ncbi:TetR family transcriptional regulator [Altererythrobacter soli]|uniref:TetR family transcriptional regulator n=1 Tax=Croceibacterium soli TaxID=1739690 RepID=A0A6I4UTQ0_9SPHN|nr:helix-turn-helix domain-containing protein [Croceibacterium soli]MXP41154.1 TetR family transcriptional regulator [Croceibacterium soli]
MTNGIAAHRAPQQKRSLAATQRMLEAGRELLNDRDIDQISVQDIVRVAGTSVGSFYHNFGTKDRFFATLVQEMATNREAIAMANFAGTPFDQLAKILVHGAVENHRRYQGLLRSTIRQHLSGSPVWEPITVMGQHITEEYIRRLELHLERPLKAREKERVAFAFVWLYGILAQSVLGLNTLSAYRIPDELFEEETTHIFSSLLQRAVPEKPVRSRPR